MKLYQLLQSFEFEEIFPTVNVMFPNAQLHRDIFEKAFDMLCNIQPIMREYGLQKNRKGNSESCGWK